MPAESSPQPNPAGNRPRIVLMVVVMAIALAVAIAGSFTGCGQPGAPERPAAQGMPKDVVTVFFSKYQGNHSIVEDVVRRLPATEKAEPLRFALTELLKGPTAEEKNQGFYSEIPAGTQLLGLNRSQDKVIVNLSGAFNSGGGSNSMTQRFEQVKQTVFSVDSRRPVSLAVEGKPLETLGGEGLEVPEPLQHAPQ